MVESLLTTAAVLVLFFLLSEGEARELEEGDFDYYYDPVYTRTRSKCDLYNYPSSKDRVCRWRYDSDDCTAAVQWYTGTLPGGERCDELGPPTTWKDCLSFCPGYVGMRMSLWCDFNDNSTSLIYKDGRPLTGNATVTFNRLKKENEGVYQCMSINGSLIGEFNMTVQSEVHIGGANLEECVPFNVGQFYNEKCCYYPRWMPSSDVNVRNPFSFAIYGDDPKITSVSKEWYTPREYHYPTDVSVFFNTNATDPDVLMVMINYYHDPRWVTDVEGSELKMGLQITVSNNFSSSSLCITVRFQKIGYLSTNISLPENVVTTVGGDATFVCQFGSSDSVEELLMRFKLVLPEENFDGNNSLTTKCYFWDDCEEWTSTTNVSTVISIRPIRDISDSSYTRYSYEISLRNVEESLNGSVFSCSVSTFSPTDKPGGPQEFIEWEGSAELVVNQAAENTIKVTNYRIKESDANRKVIASITVPVNLLVVFILFVVVLLVAMRVRKMKTHHVLREPARIPLTDQSYLSTSQSTINSEVETPVTEVRQLPAISIFEVGGAQQDLIVGEMLQDTKSMDSGVSCTEDYDNSRRRPNSLQMNESQRQSILECVSPLRLCRSEADIIDSDKALTIPQTNLRSPRQKIVIYISYTDSTSRWVRSTLKPLIDSWNIAEVMIPDRDMVAGKAISNERRRLIVEADKIILVISPDYYDSEWCSYELMHAIQSEPTLSRGRIIPILIDGCQFLPQNMEVVVPLLAHELDFSTRLRTAICPYHRLSQ